MSDNKKKKEDKKEDKKEEKKDDNDVEIVYHYTSAEAAEKIIQSGEIQQSTDGTTDIKYGKGVYLTGMDPTSNSSTDIAKNNYDSGPSVYKNRENKTEVAMEFHLPKNQVKTQEDKQGRDISLHQGNLSMDKVKKIHYLRQKPDDK